MAITITIQGTPIDFPSSSESPNWAPALIQFAQLVEGAIQSFAGAFDIPPQFQNIDANDSSTDVLLTNLNFSTGAVRSAFVRYAVWRKSSLTEVVESGTIYLHYNESNPTNNKWEISQERNGSSANISFMIDDSGQVKFTTTTIGGTNHQGKVHFAAQTLAQS